MNQYFSCFTSTWFWQRAQVRLLFAISSFTVFIWGLAGGYSAQLMASDAVSAAPDYHQHSQNPHKGQGNWLLSKYDLNGDSRITEDEVVSKRLNIFRYLDADKDAAVSFSEYALADKARRNNLLKARFAKIDGDGDGLVSETEYSNFLGLFSSIDLNADGVLSSVELQKSGANADDYCLLWFCFRTSIE